MDCVQFHRLQTYVCSAPIPAISASDAWSWAVYANTLLAVYVYRFLGPRGWMPRLHADTHRSRRRTNRLNSRKLFVCRGMEILDGKSFGRGIIARVDHLAAAERWNVPQVRHARLLAPGRC